MYITLRWNCNITDKNGQTMHSLSIWLVALCPGLKAVDMLGWLFILITISPPLQSCPKYLKTIKKVFFVHQLITVMITWPFD